MPIIFTGEGPIHLDSPSELCQLHPRVHELYVTVWCTHTCRTYPYHIPLLLNFSVCMPFSITFPDRQNDGPGGTVKVAVFRRSCTEHQVSRFLPLFLGSRSDTCFCRRFYPVRLARNKSCLALPFPWPPRKHDCLARILLIPLAVTTIRQQLLYLFHKNQNHNRPVLVPYQ